MTVSSGAPVTPAGHAPVCSCAPRALATGTPAWSDAADSHGYSQSEVAGALPGFPANMVHEHSVVAACGRIFSPARVDAAAVDEHAAGEVAKCAAIAAAAAAALEDLYVRRGDEGDHCWQPFCAPLLEGEDFDAVDETTEGVLREAALHAACGGALWPELRFKVHTLEFEACRVVDEAEGDDELEAQSLAEAAAWRAAEAAMRAHGAERVTFFRPLEHNGANYGCIFPHFAVGVTPAGSLAGVVGVTVWT